MIGQQVAAVPGVAGPIGPPNAPVGSDHPRPRRRIPPNALLELAGSLVASWAILFLVFKIADVSGPVGFWISVYILFLAIYAILTLSLQGLQDMKDRLATVLVWSGGLIAFTPLVAIILYVAIKGTGVVFSDFPHFLTANRFEYGVGPAIVGTMEQVGGAMVITVPLAVLTATYLVETNTRYSRAVRTVVDAMTGTPSIIAGLFLYLFWVQPHGTHGYSGFTASVALTIVMLPIVTRTAEEVLRVVPGTLREAALALGAPQWRLSLRVILPTARAGIITSIILGIARAAGETAPVLFTAHGSPTYNLNPFSGPQSDLPLELFQLIDNPTKQSASELWGIAFVLIVLVVLLFIAARLLGSSGQRRQARRARVRLRGAQSS